MTNQKTFTSSLPGRTIQMDQQKYLYFSGTSYLGIGRQPAFQTMLLEGFEKYGTIYSASRHNNVQLAIYDEAEDYFAYVNQAEGAVTVSSGLLAGQLVMSMLEGSKVIYAPGVHPALWEHAAIHYDFLDSVDFSNSIADRVAEIPGKVMICANTIDPLTCQPISFDWVEELPDNQDITLVFDDSHAFGIKSYEQAFTGSFHGKGSYSFLRSLVPAHIKLIVISSMAKASGIPGGIIFSDNTTIRAIKSMPLFSGATPIVPAYLYAFLHTKSMYDQAHQWLMRNIGFFMEYNSGILNQFRYISYYPVFYTTRNELYPKLMDEKILISSFAYPDPEAPPITRIVISALHTEEDIKALNESLKRCT